MKYFCWFETWCDLTDLFLSLSALIIPFQVQSKSSVVMLNSYMFWILTVLHSVTDRCFLQFLRDNQNQESGFQHWLLEGETDRRRSERNGQPDTWRRCGWWKTIRFLSTCHLEVCWYTKEAELKILEGNNDDAIGVALSLQMSSGIPVLNNVQRRTMKGPV